MTERAASVDPIRRNSFEDINLRFVCLRDLTMVLRTYELVLVSSDLVNCQRA